MKPFYEQSSSVGVVSSSAALTARIEPSAHEHTQVPAPSATAPARIAIYDSPGAAPRVEEIAAGPVGDYIGILASRIYELAREQGGEVPYTVIREVAENFIHADFREPVVSILDRGATIRFADQGPGIPDKERAVLPGFTSASSAMKRFIRGVGSGLPIVREYLSYAGGSLRIDDNLGGGAVVTITSRPSLSVSPRPHKTPDSAPARSEQTLLIESEPPVHEAPLATEPLSIRQKRVLALVMESGSAGPSIISKELSVGLSTAYRDLAHLEEMGLIAADEGGKRSLTDKGTSLLDNLIRA